MVGLHRCFIFALLVATLGSSGLQLESPYDEVTELSAITWTEKIRTENELYQELNRITSEIRSQIDSKEILRRMITWYSSGSWLFSSNRSYSSSYSSNKAGLIRDIFKHTKIIDNYPFTNNTQINEIRNSLRQIRTLLHELFLSTDTNANNVYQLLKDNLFLNPYINSIDYRLIFNSVISSGNGVDSVYVIYDDYAFKYEYVLKIFADVEECIKEESIMLHIRKNTKEQINIAQIILYYDNDKQINCTDHSAILIQHIDGVILKDHNFFENDDAVTLIESVTPTITFLSSIGIGHFNLNENNIFLDYDGTFWIHNFNSAVNFHINSTSMCCINTPFMGDFGYFSPQLWKLNQIVNKEDVKVSLIRDADLYSLQVIALAHLRTIKAMNDENDCWNLYWKRIQNTKRVLQRKWNLHHKLNLEIFKILSAFWHDNAHSPIQYFRHLRKNNDLRIEYFALALLGSRAVIPVRSLNGTDFLSHGHVNNDKNTLKCTCVMM